MLFLFFVIFITIDAFSTQLLFNVYISILKLYLDVQAAFAKSKVNALKRLLHFLGVGEFTTPLI